MFLMLAVAMALPAAAGKTTVCSITVNSADEREAFRAALPPEQYDFVELVEHGRPDWLASACRRGVQCDVLVVSGHFAGKEFYTSRFDRSESLPVDEMERAVCSQSCPGVFSQLKEVYLFGCDTLKPEPPASATPIESNREIMRRLFADVPVIYGFATFAPFGRTAGPMLARHFQESPTEAFGIGSGRVSPTLLARFSNTGMVVADGLAGGQRQACVYHDDRITQAQKLGEIHRVLGTDAVEVRASFTRIEKFFATPREDPEYAQALAALARDRAAAERFLALQRETDDPDLRLRMIGIARTIGWLSPAEHSAEHARLVRDVVVAGDMGYGEVDLICALNKDRALDAAKVGVKASSTVAIRPAPSAALACLGSREAHARVLKALASADEGDVRIAQAYLRHRPIADGSELLSATRAVARMKPSGAQARAIETLARHHLADRRVLDELSQLYARTPSPLVQRALAEAFLRADRSTLAASDLAAHLRRHRVRSPDGGRDLIDVLLERLQAPADKG